jgi:hypothetical protein
MGAARGDARSSAMGEMHQGLRICMVHDKISPFSKKWKMKSFESA